MAISVYGYLKRVAAINCVQSGKKLTMPEDAHKILAENIQRLRNPFLLDSESGFDWTVNPETTGH